MTKPIIMVAPKEERVVDPEGDDRRSKLAKMVLDTGSAVVKEHPEVKVFMVNMWTPRMAIDIAPVHDHVHTAILTGDHEVTKDELGAFLDLIIPSLIKLRVGLLTDDSPVEDAFASAPSAAKH